MRESRSHSGDIVLYSPTGSGKTLAVAIPLLRDVSGDVAGVQAVVIAPSRELVVQLYDVIRVAAATGGIKVTCCYGGHNVEDERRSLEAAPAIVISTPGRLLDHAKRRHVALGEVRQLVLDEFDKSLELGFESEMRQLMKLMRRVRRRIYTSATVIDLFPDFAEPRNVKTLDFLPEDAASPRLTQWGVRSAERDKLSALRRLLLALSDGKVIVFVNYRDAAVRVHDYLISNDIDCGLYHGGLDQLAREQAVITFNNGSHQVLVATDLASRGLDIERVEHVVHYHQPVDDAARVHRNGRTARVTCSGNAYYLLGPTETMPDDVDATPFDIDCPPRRSAVKATLTTLHFAAGKKEKLSRGDIAGFIAANADGLLRSDEIGKINVADHYVLVAVPSRVVGELLKRLNANKVKRQKVRVTIVK